MCVCFPLAKSTVKRSSRNVWNAQATRCVQWLYLDLIRRFKHQSLGGAYYALVIVDDFSGLTDVYILLDIYHSALWQLSSRVCNDILGY